MSSRIEERLNGLRHVPPLEPPPALESRVLAAMENASARYQPGSGLLRAAVWLIVIGTAAVLAAVALAPRDPPPASAPAGTDAELAAVETIERELLRHSARLEQALAALPPRPLMRVSTAGTIVGLESRIAWIDQELGQVNRSSLAPEYRLALLVDRVDAMNALFTVRYAQVLPLTY